MPPGEDAPPALGTSGYWCPSTEAELQQLLRAHPDAPLLAGGTDFMLEITQRYRHFETLIDLSGVDALRGIEETEATWNIGAAVVLHELEAFFASRLAPLARLLKRFGSRQIRHRATLGGNLANASPLADLPPLLLVLDATLVLRDALGAERRLRVSDFYRGYKRTELRPREYIARALVPRPASGQRVELHKLSKRYEDDSAAVMLAVSIGVAGNVRVAFGGMAATPARAHAAEAALRGHALAPDSIEAALQAIGEDFAPIDDVRASARYRLDMARNLLRRALVTDAAATIFDDG
jgi:xanthine dehydrogenase small subunit